MASKKQAKNKGGRPSKKNTIHYDGLKLCYGKGFTDEETALALQITFQTLNNWKKKDPEFFESLKDWKASADRDVEKSLYDRARGWTDSTGKEYPPDPTSMIFWLKNRNPRKWRDKQDVEHSGGITHTVKDGIEFDAIKKARRNSSK